MGFSALRLRNGLAVAVLGLFATVSAPAQAQIGSDRYAAIVVESRSGNVLLAHNPDEQRYPASLTKIMTVYMAFEAIRDGRTSLSDTVRVSGTAASMPPSRLGLQSGMTLTVEEAILALVTKSANDAAAALGEHLGGGSEQRFAQMMTMRARALGMTRTTFRNASGLPDYDQVTTARDMALLGRRLVQDFPRQYAMFASPHFQFRGRTHWNHNRLLQEYDGTDGIKTGYINDSGFNLVASAQRDGVRLVGAVFGGRTGRERDRHMMAILDQGFGQLGIAPREPSMAMAARRMQTPMLANAHAASRTTAGRTQMAAARTTRQGAQATRLARAPTAPAARTTLVAANARAPQAAAGRPATLTLASARTGTARIEQGDTSRPVPRGSVTRTASAPAKATQRSTAGRSSGSQQVASASRSR